MASASSTTSESIFADADMDTTNLLTDSSGGDHQKSNALSIYCPHCPSLILRPGQGVYENGINWQLEGLQDKIENKNVDEINGLQIPDVVVDDSKIVDQFVNYKHFWRIDDIFTFENIGYTKTVNGLRKYLICADCECGPLGVQVIGDDEGGKKNSSYLALARVIHR